MIRFWTEKDVARIQGMLPAGVSVEVEPELVLKGGDIWTMTIVDQANDRSVCICRDSDSEEAHRLKMTIIWVEEDRHEPRWREKFGALENAVRRCVEICKNGREVVT